MSLDIQELQQTMLFSLGESVDEIGGWRSGGASAKRNTLLTQERVINRVLNSMTNSFVNVEDLVDGFSSRFDIVIGDHLAGDLETFQAIGSNLIQAIKLIQDKTHVHDIYEREVLQSGASIALFETINHGFQTMDSRITELEEYHDAFQMPLPLTDLEIEEMFTEVFGQ
jgi:hypothetical protein